MTLAYRCDECGAVRHFLPAETVPGHGLPPCACGASPLSWRRPVLRSWFVPVERPRLPPSGGPDGSFRALAGILDARLRFSCGGAS